MADDFRPKNNDEQGSIENTIITPIPSPNSDSQYSPYSQYSYEPHKPKRKLPKGLTTTVGLCIMSALIGGISAAAIAPSFSHNDNTPLAATSASGTKTTSNSVAQVSTSSTSQTSSYPVVQIAKAVSPAVVEVSNFQSGQSYFGQSSSLQEAGTGSGFIIDAQNGYIVTNNHVIDGAQKITVTLSDGRNLTAKLVGADPNTDLAVLQISAQNLTAVQLGDSSNLQVGEPVVAIGNPGGAEFAGSITAGVISATNRTLDIQGENSFNLIQTDAAINPGNSGGPLVDYQGKVIGINSAKYAETGFEGMGFSIPISDALPTIQQLIKSGVATHPALLVGVNDQYLSYAQQNNLPTGAYISSVTPGGPADKAGIEKGDVITKINDTAVTNSTDLVHELYKYSVGSKISVTFVRNGQTKTVQATLGKISSNQ